MGWITKLTPHTPPAIAIAAVIGQRGFCTSVHSFRSQIHCVLISQIKEPKKK